MKKNSKKGKLTTRPTRVGYILFISIFAMLVASTNYGNNMAYILTFVLMGIVPVSFLGTRNNLKGLEIQNVMPQPAFAGSRVRFTMELHNSLSGHRHGIYLTFPGATSAADLFGPFDVAPHSSTTAEITIPAEHRGRFSLSDIIILTIFPLGLYRAWTPLPASKTYIVYPKPGGYLPWPEPEIHTEGDGEGSHLKGGDDFVGTRPYRLGESMRHIDWKAVARGRPMSVKEFTGGGSGQLWFDFTNVGNLDTEERLSQLTRWVLEADERGSFFGLRLGGKIIDLGSGSGHTLKCLGALALFGY